MSVFVNRALGAELKGEYAYISNWISIIVIVGGFGIYQLYPFYRRQNGERSKGEFIGLTLTLSFVYFVLSLFYCLVKPILSKTEFPYIDLLVCMIIISSVVNTEFMMFASIDDFKKCKVYNIAACLIRFLVFLAIYFLFPKNIVAILIGDLIYHVTGVIMYSILLDVKKSIIIVPMPKMIGMLKLGIIPMVFQLLLSLNYNIDVIYMKRFSDVSLTNIGLYSVGVQLAGYIWTIPDIFKEVLYSKTAKDNSINDIKWCLRISIIIELLFLVFIYLIGDKILLIMYGEEFVDAIGVTKIIFFGVLAMTLFKVLTPLYNAEGKFVANLIILAASVAINLVFNIILIPRYGMTGAAVASVFGYCVCGIVYLLRFSRDFKLPLKNIFLFRVSDIKSLLLEHGITKR